jgi:hypothetical protein
MIAMKSSNLHEHERRTGTACGSCSLSPRGKNTTDKSKMKKVSVASLLKLVTADTTETSSAVPTRQIYADRMSWQATNWDEMERCHDNNTRGTYANSRRQSCKSESSTGSFYQPLINEVDLDEVTRET